MQLIEFQRLRPGDLPADAMGIESQDDSDQKSQDPRMFDESLIEIEPDR